MSGYLKRVGARARFSVIECRQEVLVPAEALEDTAWARRLVAEGRATWDGGKPSGIRRPIRIKGMRTVSDAVLEGRK